jgi:glucose/arabinose dehydrogenase
LSVQFAALILTGLAAVAALLVWTEAVGRLMLPTLFVLGAAGVVVVAVSLRGSDTNTYSGVVPTVPPQSPTPSGPPVMVADKDKFVIEPASEPGAFDLPTSMTLDDAGNLYVGYEQGIDMARDLDGDGTYEDIHHFGHDGGWVFGLDFYQGSLYAAIDGSVRRFTDEDGDGVSDEETVLLSGLPQEHYGGHSNSGLAITPDGLIYMTVGGTSDHGPEVEPLGGTILTMPTAGGTADGYATGFRNPYDIAFCLDRRLYASDNGPDEISDGVEETAPDEVNLVLQGRNYGYPDYYGVQDPSTGTESPIANLPLRAGATGIVCHDGGGWPADFAGNLFVTMWGTFTAPQETGRRVMRVQLQETADGRVTGTTTEFAANFGHPIDIVEEADGNLLVLDFELGQLFRIRYVG